MLVLGPWALGLGPSLVLWCLVRSWSSVLQSGPSSWDDETRNGRRTWGPGTDQGPRPKAQGLHYTSAPMSGASPTVRFDEKSVATARAALDAHVRETVNW